MILKLFFVSNNVIENVELYTTRCLESNSILGRLSQSMNSWLKYKILEIQELGVEYNIISENYNKFKC